MSTKLVKHIGLALLSFGMLCTASQAAVLTVGQPNTPCPNAQYTTIGAAVAAAASGDTIAICPALYPEQLIVTKPLTLVGLNVVTSSKEGKYGVNRVLIQPTLTNLQNLPYESVITAVNTSGVTIENVAVDASQNTVSGCSPTLPAIHFFNF